MNTNSLIEKFSQSFMGDLIVPENEKYNKARQLWNGLYDKFPVAIAYCRNSDDVIEAVNFVRENDMIFSVRGGGHDYAGNSVCDDGLVIDLSMMNKVKIDKENKKAYVQAGAKVGEFDAAAQVHGLATPTGTVSTIGIGGLALGGGSGYLSPRFGLTLDNILSVKIVTADGRLLTANEKENEDLFWAVRGGGGNFGIVTSFEFQLHEIGPEVLSFQSFFAYQDSEEVLRFYRDFMKNAPEELQCYAFFLNVPPVDPFPQEYHGKTSCALIACYSGDPGKGREVLKPLENLENPILKFLQPMEYTALQKSFDAGMPKGLRWYSKAHYLSDLSDTALDILMEFTETLPGAYTMVYLEPVGRAVGNRAPNATAFPHRNAAYSLHIFPGWEDGGEDEKNIAWAKQFHKKMETESNGGVYVNLLAHDEKERIKAAYGKNYGQLVEVKKKWDPNNFFRSNHNVEPT